MLSGVCLVLAQTPPPQQPVFRAGTATVPVYVSVTDDNGQFVLNLTSKDFVVRDNGKPQTITAFITDVQPITAVLLLDASRSMVNALDQVVAGADHFVVRMMPGSKGILPPGDYREWPEIEVWAREIGTALMQKVPVG